MSDEIWILKRSKEFNYLMEVSKMKPVIIKYTATWCGPCKKIKPFYKKLAQDYPEIQFVEIDIDRFDKISRNIEIVPTYLVYKDGQIVKKRKGSDEDKLEKIVKYYS